MTRKDSDEQKQKAILQKIWRAGYITRAGYTDVDVWMTQFAEKNPWAWAYLLPEGHPRRRTVQFVFKDRGKPR